MIELCNKNMPCCGCSNADTCTKSKTDDLMRELFTKYGTMEKSYNTKQFYITAEHPEKIHNKKVVLSRLEDAQKDIEKLEKHIAMLQAYKMELVNRYNYLETTPTKEKIKLERYKKYQGNVFYYIIFYDVDLSTGHEEETDRKTYKGTERKQAFSDFEKIIKEHKNAIIEKDIEKRQWEK